MKKVFNRFKINYLFVQTIFVFLYSILITSCTEDSIFSSKIQNLNGTITVSGIKPGGLERAMFLNLGTVKKLIISDTIDSRDFVTLRDKMPLLSELDLSNATIAAYNGFYGTGGTKIYSYSANCIPDFAFYNPDKSIDNKILTTIKLPNNITTIRDYAFNRCVELTGNIIIPQSVTDTIGKFAFAFCSKITSFSWSSMSFIGKSAFQGCSGLTGNLEIPTSVLRILESTFASCGGLNSINIPASVEEISNFAFKNCGASINVDPNNPYYSSTDGVLFSFDKTTLIQCPISKTGNYEVPSNVFVIANSAFYNCAGLNSIIIPGSVFYFDDYAFSGCSGLTGSFPISDGIFGIGNSVFEGCTQITSFDVNPNNTTFLFADGVLLDLANTSVKQCVATKTGSYLIPNDITNIENGAFSGCTKLTSVSIPASITSIGHRAFANCTSMLDIYSLASSPVYLDYISTPFENINKNLCTLHVPTGSIENYRTAECWKDFINIVEM